MTVDEAIATLADRGTPLDPVAEITLRVRMQLLQVAVEYGHDVATAAARPIDLFGVHRRREKRKMSAVKGRAARALAAG